MAGLYYFIPMVILMGVMIGIVRIGTEALVLTGLDRRRAKFQALSAITGTGFTTSEAESVMEDERRRRIVSWLMILGNVGLASVLAVLVGGMVKAKTENLPIHVIYVVGAIVLGKWVFSVRALRERYARWLKARLSRFKFFRETAVFEVMHMSGEHGIFQARVSACSAVRGCSVEKLSEIYPGVLLLRIVRNDCTYYSPLEDMKIEENDTLALFGRRASVESIVEEISNER